MKIGINTLFYIPGEVGGSETYLIEILREWKHSVFAHEVVLFTQQDNHERLKVEFEGENWMCIRCPFSAQNRVLRILREQIELPFKVKKAGVDVLWSPGYTAPFMCASPQVVSILDMQYKSFPQDLSFVGRWTTEILVQIACLRAKRLLTISQFSKNEILKLTKAKPEQVQVTLLAASPDFSPDKTDSIERSASPFILCVANTYPHKNVDQLIRAFALIEDDLPHQLVLIGKERLGEPEVQKALQKVKNPQRVVRKSGLSREELIFHYAQADLYVFPSLYEGFGLPVLEAMQAEVPAVTTRCGSIPEVGGAFVRYYDHNSDQSLADEIKAALAAQEPVTDSEARKSWLEQFRWSETATKTLEGLKSVM